MVGKVFTKAYWQDTWRYLTDFDREKSLAEKFEIIFGILAVNLLYIVFIINFLQFILPQSALQKYVYWGWMVNDADLQEQMRKALMKNWTVAIFFMVFLAPIWEEFAFRVYWFWNRLRERAKEASRECDRGFVAAQGRMPLWPLVVMSSIIFGLVHGGPINVLIQGVGGLFLSYAFLINNRSYLSAVILHALYNGMILLTIYIGSKSAIMALTLPYWL